VRLSSLHSTVIQRRFNTKVSQSRKTRNCTPIISLLTDFGVVDPFVAEMKAVILSICPQARIVDISHEVVEFDVRMGALILAEASRSFPEGTIHIAVVDPGVGSSRRAIVVKTKRSTYLGPDNGLLIPSATMDGIIGVFEISNRSMMLREVSRTFHGRDIFAPAAAHIACGHLPEECGANVNDYATSPFRKPVLGDKSTTCEVLHIDRFGNLVTNLTPTNLRQWGLRLGQEVTLSTGGRKFRVNLVRTFSDIYGNRVGLMSGSHGFVEIACRESKAVNRLRVRRGSVLRVSGY